MKPPTPHKYVPFYTKDDELARPRSVAGSACQAIINDEKCLLPEKAHRTPLEVLSDVVTTVGPKTPTPDAVTHPSHYSQVPGIECIDVVKHFDFLRGNVIRYVWRAGHKDDALTDLRKAEQYIRWAIEAEEAKQ